MRRTKGEEEEEEEEGRKECGIMISILQVRLLKVVRYVYTVARGAGTQRRVHEWNMVVSAKVRIIPPPPFRTKKEKKKPPRISKTVKKELGTSPDAVQQREPERFRWHILKSRDKCRLQGTYAHYGKNI